jgi:hypothetical protein
MSSLIHYYTLLEDRQRKMIKIMESFEVLKEGENKVEIIGEKIKKKKSKGKNTNQTNEMELGIDPQDDSNEIKYGILTTPLQKKKKFAENVLDLMKKRLSFIQELVLGNLFESIFVQRYRDTHAAIRCMCLRRLGEWLTLATQFFLSSKKDNASPTIPVGGPTNLKYLGWMFYDKVCIFF